ncbi:MAG: class I SAM-dependent methyltransferase [Spirochaetota bacterium]
MPKSGPFEEYTVRYEEWFEKNKYVYESELQAVKALMPPNLKGLEVGVGSGRFALHLGIGYGVEPSKKMRELAIRRGINVVDGVGEELPYEEGSFDVVLMVTTLCFLDDVEKAFGEVYRVLKKGGCFINGFVDKNSCLGKLYQRHKNENVFYKIARFYSTEQVVSYLNAAGFYDFECKQTIFQDLNKINAVEPVKEGFGEGSFVVVRAKK